MENGGQDMLNALYSDCNAVHENEDVTLTIPMDTIVHRESKYTLMNLYSSICISFINIAVF